MECHKGFFPRCSIEFSVAAAGDSCNGQGDFKDSAAVSTKKSITDPYEKPSQLERLLEFFPTSKRLSEVGPPGYIWQNTNC